MPEKITPARLVEIERRYEARYGIRWEDARDLVAYIKELQEALDHLLTDFDLCYAVLEGRGGYCLFAERETVRRAKEVLQEKAK